MSISPLSRPLVYAQVPDLLLFSPDASSASLDQQTHALREAHILVDALSGAQESVCLSQPWQFPRQQDTRTTRNRGTWDPTTEVFPCPVHTGDFWQVSATHTFAGQTYTTGQYLLAGYTHDFCPISPDYFSVLDSAPGTTYAPVPWGVHQATLLLASSLLPLYQASPELQSPAIAPGMQVKLGDFSFSRTEGTLDRQSARSFVSTLSVGQRVLSILAPFRQITFSF